MQSTKIGAPPYPSPNPVKGDGEDGRLGPPLAAINGGPSMSDELFDQLARRNELAQWWRDRAEAEIGQTVDKAIEYGSQDLVEIGRQLVEAGVRLPDSHIEDPAIRNAYFAELGIYMYVVGKIARWTSAINEGRQVSNDTILDLGIYLRMLQRVRETGRWP